MKNFKDEKLLHKLFQIIKKQTKKTNAKVNIFTDNISTDINLSIAKISKIIHSGESFDSWWSNLGKKALTNIAISLARGNLPGLVSNITSNAMNKYKIKISRKGAVRAGKRFTLLISNEDINDIIKIIKSLEDSGVLINGVAETVKHE